MILIFQIISQIFIKFLNEYENELKRLLKLNNLSFYLKTNKVVGAAYIVIGDTALTIPLKNIVDTRKEVKKLQEKEDKKLLI